jgi:prolyl 4-hydroxylase
MLFFVPKFGWIVIDCMNFYDVKQFKRATVHDHATGELVTAQYRISKSSWLQGQEHPAIDTVNKRITAITGLDLDTAEELQVVNYGLGGHYEPHFDFARVCLRFIAIH